MIAITFYGVRGSTPCHGESTRRYGGNTSCVAVRVPGEWPLVLDLGTGLRYLGLEEPDDEPFRGNCLLTHLHWDHIQGVAFFTPLLRPGAELHIYGPVQDDGRAAGDVIADVVRPPMFPIPITEIPGTVHVHDVGRSEFALGRIQVLSRPIPHVGTTLGYRLTWEGRSVAYLPDHQQPEDGSLGVCAEALELAGGADVLIHDAQYTPEEFAVKNTWGHSTVAFALEVARLAGVRTLVLFHHDPQRIDDEVDEQHRWAAEVAGRSGIELVSAGEGLTLRLD